MEKTNFKKEDAGCDKYGEQRLELAVYLKNNILNDMKNEWFIENGTLLGAWRNGTFIPHDDDFDMVILIDTLNDIKIIYEKINKKLINTKYKARLISEYAYKIEIYDESYGDYKLIGKAYNGANYHYVTLDLQFYVKVNENQYKYLYFINPSNSSFIFDKDLLLPVKKIKLENEYFNAPSKIKNFLEKHYGSLDPNASYNSKTGYYEI